MNDGWYPDPSGRFPERYVLRGEWSALVRRGEEELIDAPVGIPLRAGAGTAEATPQAAAPAPRATVAAPPPPPTLRATAPTSALDDWGVPDHLDSAPADQVVSVAASPDPPTESSGLPSDQLEPPHAANRWVLHLVAIVAALALLAVPALAGELTGGAIGPLGQPWPWLAVAALASALAARRSGAPRRIAMGVEVPSPVPTPARVAPARVAPVPLALHQPHRPRWTRVVLRAASWLVLAGLLGGGLFVGYRRLIVARDQGPWASSWDPKVEGVKAFVEGERGLTFQHPVKVEFLSDEEFLEWFGVGDPAAAIDPTTAALLGALGLVEPTDNLDQAADDLAGSVVGFYSYDDKVVRLRGRTLTPELYVTLAHELTHALQDQHFDLAALSSAASSNSASMAARAVFEGDATLVERAFVETLSPQERAQLDAATEAVIADASGVPRLLSVLQGYPYIFGDWFISSVTTISGQTGRDQIFGRLPTTELQILDPHLYLSGFEPVAVPEPALGPGEVAAPVQFDGMGMLAWYLVLGERIGAGPAWEATRGWRGESAISLTAADGRVCERVSVAFESDVRAQVFAFALASVVQPASLAASSATQVDVTLCEGDAWQPLGDDDTDDLIWVPFVNFEVQQSMLAEGYPADLSACVADTVIGRPDALDALQREDAAAYQGLLPGIVAGCP